PTSAASCIPSAPIWTCSWAISVRAIAAGGTGRSWTGLSPARPIFARVKPSQLARRRTPRRKPLARNPSQKGIAMSNNGDTLYSQDGWFDLVRVVGQAAPKRGMRLEVHLTRPAPSGGPLVQLVDWPTASAYPPKRRRPQSVPCATTDNGRLIPL